MKYQIGIRRMVVGVLLMGCVLAGALQGDFWLRFPVHALLWTLVGAGQVVAATLVCSTVAVMMCFVFPGLQAIFYWTLRMTVAIPVFLLIPIFLQLNIRDGLPTRLRLHELAAIVMVCLFPTFSQGFTAVNTAARQYRSLAVSAGLSRISQLRHFGARAAARGTLLGIPAAFALAMLYIMVFDWAKGERETLGAFLVNVKDMPGLARVTSAFTIASVVSLVCLLFEDLGGYANKDLGEHRTWDTSAASQVTAIGGAALVGVALWIVGFITIAWYALLYAAGLLPHLKDRLSIPALFVYAVNTMPAEHWDAIVGAVMTTLVWVLVAMIVAFVSAVAMAVLSLSSRVMAAVLEILVSVTQYVPIVVWFPLLLLVTSDVIARAVFIGTLGGAFEAFVFLKGKLLGLDRGIALVRRTWGTDFLLGIFRRMRFLLLPFAASYSTITLATVLPNVFIMIILADELLNLPSFWTTGGIGYLFTWRFRMDLPELAVLLFTVVGLTTGAFLIVGMTRIVGARVRRVITHKNG